MINLRKIQGMIKDDHVLNLSQLAHATGYGRTTLKKMQLPLINGKMRLTDFWRIIRKRQDALEKQSTLNSQPSTILAFPATPPPEMSGRLAPSISAESSATQTVADKFRAPRSSCARPAASHRRGESRARNIA